jgi:hypothetical protein
MKRLLAAAALTLPSVVGAAVVDIPFFDAGGMQYTTGNYRGEITKRFPGTHPTLFLIVTRDAMEPEFVKQMAVLKQLDAEALQLIFVVGTPSPANKGGYWLEPENVDALLEGGARFEFIAIADGGTVCFSSQKSVNREKIVASNNALQPTFLRCAQKRG